MMRHEQRLLGLNDNVYEEQQRRGGTVFAVVYRGGDGLEERGGGRCRVRKRVEFNVTIVLPLSCSLLRRRKCHLFSSTESGFTLVIPG